LGVESLYTPDDPYAGNPGYTGYQWWLNTTNTFNAWDKQRVSGAWSSDKPLKYGIVF
jgi:hypothetical protein